MNFLRFILVWVSLVLIASQLHSQISGIAGTKIAAFHAQAVDLHTTEFEPTYNYSRNIYAPASDSVSISSNISWRVSYGLSEKVEVGFNSGGNFSSACIASKVEIYEKEKIGLALMCGVGLQLGNFVKAPGDDLISGYGVGAISTYQIDDKNSIDANVQFYKNNGSFDSFFATVDYGTYSVSDKVLLILGFNYQTTDIDPIISTFLGVSIETAENYALVLSPTFTLSGANILTNPQTYGFGFSYTSLWD